MNNLAAAEIPSHKSADPCPSCGNSPSRSAASERVFFEEGLIRVTASRVIFPTRTFCLANLSSVVARGVGPRVGWQIALLVVGSLIAIGCFYLRIFVGGVVGGAIGIGGLVWLLLSKPIYLVCITGAGGETGFLFSKDGMFVQRLANALHEAIASRQ